MPLYHEGKSSKIFDAFAAVSHDEVLNVCWPDVELDASEKRRLSSLLEKMLYLGRAESWVEVHVSEEPVEPNCFTANMKLTGQPEHTMELTDVLVPMGKEEYLSWLKEYLENCDAKTKKKLTGLKTLKDALCIETSKLKKDGWSQPPGSKWVQYLRLTNCFEVRHTYSIDRTNETKPTTARFAVASQVPPRLTEAISVADRVHKSLVKYSDSSPVFTGRQEDRCPLSGHGHAHILCESNRASSAGKRGEITHIAIHAPIGFGKRERKALDMLKKVWGHGGHDLQLVLIGVGQPEDFGGLDTSAGQSPAMCESRVWISRTPFIPTRHPKSTRAGAPKMDEAGLHIGSPEHELIRLLAENGFPRPTSVTKIDGTDLAGHLTRWLQFKRDRYRGNGVKASNMGYGFRIVFPEPVQGPICLGYGAHFGLGLFVPADEHHNGE